MYLYLMQHGEAKSKEEDPTCSLSEKGTEDVRKIAEFARGMNIEVQRIFHSGKERALQTAQMLEGYIKVTMSVENTDGLAPMDEPEIWLTRLSDIKENTMLVGHLPQLDRLSALILTGSKGRGIIDFQRGCIVCLKRDDDGNWTVDWITKPGMLP
jgi:phosphohistidine phosphatase